MRELVAEGRCRWISNEAPNMLPEVMATAPEGERHARHFVLGVDGRMVGRTHGHRRSLGGLA